MKAGNMSGAQRSIDRLSMPAFVPDGLMLPTVAGAGTDFPGVD